MKQLQLQLPPIVHICPTLEVGAFSSLFSFSSTFISVYICVEQIWLQQNDRNTIKNISRVSRVY